MCGLEGSRVAWRASLIMLPALLAGACSEGIVGPLERMIVPSFDATFVFEYPDVDLDPTRPVESPAPDQRVGGFSYGARVVPVDTSLSSDPMGLWIVVRATNTSGDTLSLDLQGCPVREQVFEDPARDGEPIWRWARECAQQPYSRAVPPGEATELFSYLQDELPDGRYYFTVRFMLQGDTLSLLAGSADVRLRVPGLAYHVKVRPRGPYSARVEVGITNRNSETVRLTMGACAAELLLYQDERRTQLVRRWFGRGLICPGYRLIVDLEPGATIWPRESARTRHVSELIRSVGDEEGGVDPGLYHLSVRLGHNDRKYDFPVGTLMLW